MKHLPFDHPLAGRVFANEWSIGQDVVLGEGTTIGTEDMPVESLTLGDHIYIGDGCTVWSPTLSIGDYTKIHNHSLVYGRGGISLGHNVWVGQHSILDGEGGLVIEDNVGIGAHSQLWSHIRHGDTLYGCKYLNFGKLIIHKDAWCVGHCIVSPVEMAERSMLLVGSTLTKNTEPNHVYGGSPALDLTAKIGAPFRDTSVMDRYEGLLARLLLFESKHPEHRDKIVVVTEYDFKLQKVQFNVTDRTYTKTNLEFEVEFMRFLLPEAKFTPRSA